MTRAQASSPSRGKVDGRAFRSPHQPGQFSLWFPGLNMLISGITKAFFPVARKQNKTKQNKNRKLSIATLARERTCVFRPRKCPQTEAGVLPPPLAPLAPRACIIFSLLSDTREEVVAPAASVPQFCKSGRQNLIG